MAGLPFAVGRIPLLVAFVDPLPPVLRRFARRVWPPPPSGRARTVGRLRRVVIEAPVPLLLHARRSTPSRTCVNEPAYSGLSDAGSERGARRLRSRAQSGPVAQW